MIVLRNLLKQDFSDGRNATKLLKIQIPRKFVK